MTDKIENIIASAESDTDKALMIILYIETEKNAALTLNGDLMNDAVYQALAADEPAYNILLNKMLALVA